MSVTCFIIISHKSIQVLLWIVCGHKALPNYCSETIVQYEISVKTSARCSVHNKRTKIVIDVIT